MLHRTLVRTSRCKTLRLQSYISTRKAHGLSNRLGNQAYVEGPKQVDETYSMIPASLNEAKPPLIRQTIPEFFSSIVSKHGDQKA